jgi:hypothetical protein
VAHEIGHAIMDDIYEDAYPATPNCSGHKVDTASSAGCAWTEGFADWLRRADFDPVASEAHAQSTSGGRHDGSVRDDGCDRPSDRGGVRLSRGR